MGVGGVGSVTAEMLTRCGIGKVTHCVNFLKRIFVLNHLNHTLIYMYLNYEGMLRIV